MLSLLAWRNIWRNRRRSLITMASVLFAVFFAVFLRSMQIGTYDNMIENVVGYYSGYIQVHKSGYWKEQIIDHSVEYSDSLLSYFDQIEGVTQAQPRLESFALGAYQNGTKGLMVNGIVPEKEDVMMNLSGQLIAGDYIKSEDRSVIISSGAADYLKLEVGDSLVLLSQGYHGVSATGLYPIKGIVELKSPILNNNTVFMPLAEAQWFYGAQNRVTSYVFLLDGNSDTRDVQETISQSLDTAQYEVMDWTEMMPELVQAIEADSTGGQLMLFILYMIITFGIFGTVLMMTAERTHEFGILLSVGMSRIKLGITLIMETVFLAINGVLAGMIAVTPLVLYFYFNPLRFSGNAQEAFEEFGFEPILPASIDPSIWLTHAWIILLIAIVISFYPMYVVLRIKPIDAMRK